VPTLQLILKATGFAWILLIATMGGAHADTFNERIRGPAPVSAEQLKEEIRRYFTAFERATRNAGPGGLLRDPAAYRRWFDLDWRISRMIDKRMPLGDVEEFGLRARDDGSYSIDLARFPQWNPLDSSLAMLRMPEVYAGLAAEIRRRGFSDEDLAILRRYLDENDPERAAFARKKPLLEGYAAKIQARARTRDPFDLVQAMSYVYQRSRTWHDAQRVWAIGLLDLFDEQQQQILAAYFAELGGSQAIGPTEDFEAQLRQEVSMLASGAYIDALQEREAEVMQ
jgi:hypothetical protein